MWGCCEFRPDLYLGCFLKRERGVKVNEVLLAAPPPTVVGVPSANCGSLERSCGGSLEGFRNQSHNHGGDEKEEEKTRRVDDLIDGSEGIDCSIHSYRHAT